MERVRHDAPEHVAALRELTGGAVNDAALRAALVRAAGNMDRAADLLLSSPAVSSRAQPADEPSKSSRAELDVAPSKTSRAEPVLVASNPSRATPVHAEAEAVGSSEKFPPRPSVNVEPPSVGEVRKLAWKTFFKERYVMVKDELGLDALEKDKVKEAITQRICEIWRDLGADGRDALYVKALEKLEKVQKPKAIPVMPCAAGTGSSPVTPQEKANARSLEADCAASEREKKVPRAHDATDVADGRSDKAGGDDEAVLSHRCNPVNPNSHASKKQQNSSAVVDLLNSDSDFALNAVDVIDLSGKAVDACIEADADQCAIVVSADAKPEASWPRRIASRILCCTMTVSGTNVVKAGQIVELSPSNNIVRFSHRGRELGRLPSSIAPYLGPALASGFVTAVARVVEAPKVCRPLSVIYVDVNILLQRQVFQSLSALNLPAAKKNQGGKRPFKIRSGTAKRGKVRGKKAKIDDEEEGQGMDFERLSVETLMLHLDTCNSSPSVTADVELPAETPDADHGPESYLDAVRSITFPAGNSYEHPSQLKCTLREYQKVGVLWMRSREDHGSASQDDHLKSGSMDAWVHPVWRRRAFANGELFYSNRATGGFCLQPPIALQGGPYGGILADEMGLGKTVMSIAAILIDRARLDAKLGGAADEKPIEMPAGFDTRAIIVDEDEIASNASSPGTMDVVEAIDVDGGAVDEIDEEESIARINSEDDKGGNDHGIEEVDDVDDDDDWSSEGNEDGSDSDFVPDERRARAHVSPTRRRGKGKQQMRDLQSSDEAHDTSWVQKAQFSKLSKSLYCRVHKMRMKEKTGSSKKKLQGGTLLVVPMSLIGQWRSELEKHVEPGFLRCKTHHEQRGGAVGVSVTVADVVLTTYGIVSSEAPVFGSDGKLTKGGGPLFDVEWRRVILGTIARSASTRMFLLSIRLTLTSGLSFFLAPPQSFADEAHIIKNKSTKSAKACFQLCAEMKWCLTGSPIQNEVSDCQPLLRFLDVHPWSSWGFWQRGVLSKIEAADAKLKAEGYATLRSILSPITLRRLKTTVGSDGKVLVEMVERNEEIVRLTQGPAERDFYDQLHNKSKSKFDTYVAQGKVLTQWANVLELLLRLRQACCHPWLVLAAPQADAKVSDDRKGMYKMFASGGSAAFAAQMVDSTQLGGRGDSKDEQDDCGGASMLSKLCPICLSDMEDATALKRCGHGGCRECFLRMLEAAHGRPSSCPVCRAPVESRADLIRLPRGDGSSSRFPMDIRKNWKSSAKLDFIVAEVRRMAAARKESNDGAVGKTVIMSQFTSFLDIVGVALEQEGAKFLRFDGTLNAKKRADVLDQFAGDDESDPKTAQILLVSLRSGNVGLNLVSASLLILCDPSWNPMVDAQAAARVHRHGQTRRVSIKRLVIGGSVEDRLLQVQDAKRDMTEGALATASREDKELRMERMKMLFARS